MANFSINDAETSRAECMNYTKKIELSLRMVTALKTKRITIYIEAKLECEFSTRNRVKSDPELSKCPNVKNSHCVLTLHISTVPSHFLRWFH
jgi:hypothetical protein